MKKVVIGYIFNEPRLCADEKIFLKLAKKKNIDLVLINAAKDLDEAKLEREIKKCDVIYDNSSEEFSLEIAKTIESFGKKVIENPKVFYDSEDKWLFFVKCKKHNIPIPRTILLSENLNITKRELERFDSWPVILKRVSGTMGQYVEKVDNLDQAEKIILKFWKKGSERLPIIAQEFVNSPSYRVTAIDGKIVQTVTKKNRGWKSTGVYAKKLDRFKVDKELRKIVDKVLKVSGIKICGIDFLKKEGKWLVLEVNAEPAFDFFDDEREKIIGDVLDFLKKEARVI